MSDATPGNVARPRRMRKEELRALMLDTAEELLGDRGLGVNAYPLNLEELIRRAGVPRSSVFNAFGTKESLIFELALRLLPPTSPLAGYFSGMWAQILDEVVAELPGPEDAAWRRAALREVVRRSVRKNHDMLAGSSRWRTFRALSMSLDSFPDDERRVLTERLHHIQREYVAVMSACYQRVFDRFGVRLRAGIDIRHFTGSVSSALEGIATSRAFGPTVPDEVLSLPGPDGTAVDWHLSSVAFLALVEGMTEPV